jgi:hypothetical protein
LLKQTTENIVGKTKQLLAKKGAQMGNKKTCTYTEEYRRKTKKKPAPNTVSYHRNQQMENTKAAKKMEITSQKQPLATVGRI